MAILNIPDKNITTAPLTELVYKEVGVVNYKGITWRYEADLYDGEADFLSHIKPNFDCSMADMLNTDGANNLNTISVFGGRTYTCGAEANCIGNEGYIYCFTKTPDLYMFTHEIGHTWSLREDSPVNWGEGGIMGYLFCIGICEKEFCGIFCRRILFLWTKRLGRFPQFISDAR